MNPVRQPWFDIRVARRLLLYDEQTLRYCMENCKCPVTDDEYLAYDLEEARFNMGIPNMSTWTGPLSYNDGDWPSSGDEDDGLDGGPQQGLENPCGESSNWTDVFNITHDVHVSQVRDAMACNNITFGPSRHQRCTNVVRTTPFRRTRPPRPPSKPLREQRILSCPRETSRNISHTSPSFAM